MKGTAATSWASRPAEPAWSRPCGRGWRPTETVWAEPASNTGLVPEGQYAFSAFDDAGCSVDTTVSVVALSSGLSLEVELIQPSCGGALAGEASLMPMGGLPPYAVNVQGAADTVFLPFLLTGTYPVTLTDSVGCFALDTLVVDPASEFTLAAQVDSATCANSEDGQVVVLPLNATGSVDYTFVGPFGAMPAGDTIVGLGAGIYEVTGLDEAGCPAVVLVSVGAPDPSWSISRIWTARAASTMPMAHWPSPPAGKW